MLELGVAVFVLRGSLSRLLIGLKRVTELLQEPTDHIATRHVTLFRQLGGKSTEAFRCPAERRLGVPSGYWLDQSLKSWRQQRVLFVSTLSALARSSYALVIVSAWSILASAPLSNPPANRGVSHARGFMETDDATAAKRHRLRCRPFAARALAERVAKEFELPPQLFDVFHLTLTI